MFIPSRRGLGATAWLATLAFSLAQVSPPPAAELPTEPVPPTRVVTPGAPAAPSAPVTITPEEPVLGRPAQIAPITTGDPGNPPPGPPNPDILAAPATEPARADAAGRVNVTGEQITIPSFFDGRPVERLTLRTAIEMALQNNLEVKFEKTGIYLQRAQVEFAAGVFDPVFTMSSQYQKLRRAQDISNPNTTSVISSQQQLQLQLNQAAQQLNLDLLNAQAQTIAQSQVAGAQLQAQQNAINEQRALQGLPPIVLPEVQNGQVSLLNLQPIVTPTLDNIIVLDQEQAQFSASLQGRTAIGTRFAFQLSMDRYRNTFEGDTNPVESIYESSAVLSIQQPLLKNFGLDANLADLRVAKINAKVQTLTWKQTVSSSIQGVMAAYYDMLYALQDMQVREAAIQADSQLVALYERRTELGFSSPFDIRQAEVAVSIDREALLAAKNIFLERQFTLKRLILSKFDADDPRLFFPENAPNLRAPATDRLDLLRSAFRNRYDYRGTLLAADIQDVRLKFAKNQLLPSLDLIATYGLNGLDTNAGDSISQAAQWDTPQWSVGIQFQMPLGNRQPRAQYQAFLKSKEQAILRIKQSEIAVGVDVDTVLSRIETNRQRVEAARKTRELGDEAVRIAFRRLEEGQISAYDLTEQQRKLYDARSRELAALAELNKSITLLWLATGTVLQRSGIDFLEPHDTFVPPPATAPDGPANPRKAAASVATESVDKRKKR